MSDANDSPKFIEEVDNIRQELLEKLKRKWILIDEKYGMQERLISAKKWAQENPTVTLILISTFVICSLPLFCFLISLTGIFFVLLTGFIMFEGTIITLTVLVIGCVLLVGAFLTFGLSSILLLIYVVLKYVGSYVNKFKTIAERKSL